MIMKNKFTIPAIEDSLSLLNSKINKLFNSSDEDLFVLSQGGVSIFNRSVKILSKFQCFQLLFPLIENTSKKGILDCYRKIWLLPS